MMEPRGMMFSLPFMGRDREAEPSAGGEVRTTPPGFACGSASLPTSGEGESFAYFSEIVWATAPVTTTLARSQPAGPMFPRALLVKA